ncbi:hypothetical protein FRC12_003681 [Ceratobasidium sp. 428]|nr:hypothetical protein FRC12_003681 [Ceratobasidium sp. 428]
MSTTPPSVRQAGILGANHASRIALAAPPKSGSRVRDSPPLLPEPSQRDKRRADRIVAEEEEREKASDTRRSRPSTQNTKGLSAKQRGKQRAQLPSVPEEDDYSSLRPLGGYQSNPQRRALTLELSREWTATTTSLGGQR